MFVCRSCARRWRGPYSIASPGPGGSRQALLSSTVAWSSTTATPSTISGKVPKLHQLRPPRSLQSMCQFSTQLATLSDELQGKEDEDGDGKEAANKSRLDMVVKRRLRYLQDPYTIGKAVEETLDKGNYEEALQLTRMASKNHQVVVGWNHLIGHLMKKDNLNGAIKLYNEMKKRGQLPNAQTYTVIFRGCAESGHPKLAVFQATRLYFSMLASERIKPNIIHMNAVLHVCAQARDIDSLFSVAKTANLRLRMPNNLTYTTVLNGLRYSTVMPHYRTVQADGDEFYPDKEAVSVSIARARAVWQEVATNWRCGRLVIDEELVCAMGRVLLMGSYRDNDDILSLVQQAMGISRPDKRAPSLPAPNAKATDATTQEALATGNEAEASVPGAAESQRQQTGQEASTTKGDTMPDKTSQDGTVSLFSPLPPGTIGSRPINTPSDAATDDGQDLNGMRGRNSRIMYAHPGRNTLSLIMSSLGSTRKTSLATPYWDILTGPAYNVVPDSENWYRILKTLRRGHASTKTVEMMLKMPRGLMNEKTFQLAMATCAADNLNENVFVSAGKILDLMNKTLMVPDPYTLRLYLQTAVSNNRHFRNKKDPAARQTAKFAFGRQLVRALSRLWDPLRLLSNSVNITDRVFSSEEKKTAYLYNKKREMIAVARQMVSAADMVVTEGMADEATTKDVRISRNLLNRQITRFYDDRETREPNLRPVKKTEDAQGDGGSGGRETVRSLAKGRWPRARHVSGRG